MNEYKKMFVDQSLWVRQASELELYTEIASAGNKSAFGQLVQAELNRRQSKPHMPTFVLIIVSTIFVIATFIVACLAYWKPVVGLQYVAPISNVPQDGPKEAHPEQLKKIRTTTDI